jgi:hypothetical protein
MTKIVFPLILFASASVLPLTAHADAIDDFLITGNGNTITFSLPASPTDVFVSTGAGGVIGGFFPLPAPMVTANGVTASTSVEFFSGNLFFVGPGIDFVADGTVFTLVGELLYSGSAYTPTFLTGTFDLHQFRAFPNQDYTLTITPETTAPTPELSTLSLFGTGVLGLIGLVRNKRGWSGRSAGV